jgi:hypothetical protein
MTAAIHSGYEISSAGAAQQKTPQESGVFDFLARQV